VNPKTKNEIARRIRQTPMLAHSASRLLELLGDPDRHPHQVIQVVECDAVLTAQILKAVNSAAMGLREPVTTVARGVAFLGEEMILGIAFGASADQVFNANLKGYESQAGDLWRHSLMTALAARELAQLAKDDSTPGDLAYTAALLHDIGKSILSEFMCEDPQALLERVDRGAAGGFLQAETEVIGVNHSTVGAALAKHWNLPECFWQTIRFHHFPEKSDESSRVLAYIVHLADLIAMMGGSGTGMDALAYPLDLKYSDYINIDRRRFEELFVKVSLDFEKTEAMLFGEGKEGA
jgi:putative nucleotidyltransferase with HDIG domain